jgi:hypothetical protein
MDPGTATAAVAAAASTFETLNRVGGIVAVLLGLLVALVAVAIILAIRVFRHLAKRVGDVEDSRVHILTTCVAENTHQSKRSADTNVEILKALRDRPCLIETGVHHRTPLPQMRTQ